MIDIEAISETMPGVYSTLPLFHTVTLAGWLDAIDAGVMQFGPPGSDYIHGRATVFCDKEFTAGALLQNVNRGFTIGGSTVRIRHVGLPAMTEEARRIRNGEITKERDAYKKEAGRLFAWVMVSLRGDMLDKLNADKRRLNDLRADMDTTGLVKYVREIVKEELMHNGQKLKQSLLDLKYNVGQSFHTFIRQFREKLEECRLAGRPVGNQEAAEILAKFCLPGDKFKLIIMDAYMLDVSDPKYPTIDELITKLMEWRKRNPEYFEGANASGNDGDRAAEVTAQDLGSGGRSGGGRGRGGRGRGNHGGRGRGGHVKPKVVKAVNDKKEGIEKKPQVADKAKQLANLKCYNCGKKGHFQRNCPAPKKDKAEETAGAVQETMVSGDICCATWEDDGVGDDIVEDTGAPAVGATDTFMVTVGNRRVLVHRDNSTRDGTLAGWLISTGRRTNRVIMDGRVAAAAERSEATVGGGQPVTNASVHQSATVGTSASVSVPQSEEVGSTRGGVEDEYVFAAEEVEVPAAPSTVPYPALANYIIAAGGVVRPFGHRGRQIVFSRNLGRSGSLPAWLEMLELPVDYVHPPDAPNDFITTPLPVQQSDATDLQHSDTVGMVEEVDLVDDEEDEAPTLQVQNLTDAGNVNCTQHRVYGHYTTRDMQFVHFHYRVNGVRYWFYEPRAQRFGTPVGCLEGYIRTVTAGGNVVYTPLDGSGASVETTLVADGQSFVQRKQYIASVFPPPEAQIPKHDIEDMIVVPVPVAPPQQTLLPTGNMSASAAPSAAPTVPPSAAPPVLTLENGSAGDATVGARSTHHVPTTAVEVWYRVQALFKEKEQQQQQEFERYKSQVEKSFKCVNKNIEADRSKTYSQFKSHRYYINEANKAIAQARDEAEEKMALTTELVENHGALLDILTEQISTADRAIARLTSDSAEMLQYLKRHLDQQCEEFAEAERKKKKRKRSRDSNPACSSSSTPPWVREAMAEADPPVDPPVSSNTTPRPPISAGEARAPLSVVVNSSHSKRVIELPSLKCPVPDAVLYPSDNSLPDPEEEDDDDDDADAPDHREEDDDGEAVDVPDLRDEDDDGEDDDDEPPGDYVYVAMQRDHPALWYLLDSGATSHVFTTAGAAPCPVLRIDHRSGPSPSTLRNASGDIMTVTHRSVAPNWGTNLVSPSADCNLLSVPQLTRHGFVFTFAWNTVRIQLPHVDHFIEVPNDRNKFILTRAQVNVMYESTLTVIYPSTAPVDQVAGVTHAESYFAFGQVEAAVAAVVTNAAPGVSGEPEVESDHEFDDLPVRKPPVIVHYTSEQRKRAAQVKVLHDFWHLPDSLLKSALSNGLIIGSRLTEKDVDVYRAIYGPCAACVMGKRTAPSYRKPSDNPPAQAVGEVIHSDILPISNVESGYNTYMLGTVDEYSGFICLITMSSKNAKEVQEAYTKVIGVYKQYGHTVKTIISDSESVLIHAQTYLNNLGIQMFHTPPYQHAQRMERCVRTLKDRMRCLLAAMTHELPTKFYTELYKAAAFYLNILPTSRDSTITPSMLVRGTKFDMNQWTPRPFGTIALMYQHRAKSREDTPKSELGVIMGPNPTSVGCYHCVNVFTEKVVSRKEFNVLFYPPSNFPWRPNTTYMQYSAPQPAAKTEPKSESKVPANSTVSADTTVTSSVTLPAAEQHSESVTSPISTTNGTAVTDPVTSDNISPEDTTPEGEAEEDQTPDSEPQAQEHSPEGETAVDETPPEGDTAVDATPPEGEMTVDVPSREGECALPTSGTKKTKKRKATSTTASAEPTRKSSRPPAPKRWDDDCNVYEDRTKVEHACRISVKESLSGDRAEESREAIMDEIRNMLTYRVGHYVKYHDIPQDKRKNIIVSFMFLKHKENAEGEYTRTKARLVGNGAHMKDHMYDVVSSATVGLSAVFLVINIASYYNTLLTSFDIKGAFLNAPFTKDDEVIYIKINKEITKIWIDLEPSAKAFVDNRGELLLQLDKFIYGLKQAPLKFQQHLTRTLKSLGYRQLDSDECLYIKKTKSGEFSLISTHVDDILQACTSQALFVELRDGLIEAYGTVTVNENANEYLGMSIERSTCGRKITLSQQGLVKKIVKEISAAKGGNAYKSNNPAAVDLFDVPEDEQGTERPRVEYKKFVSIVMSLMYVARLTRPDILLPVTFLASRAHVATDLDMEKAIRVVRYLNNTISMGVTMYCTDLRVNVMCDASFAIHADGKGHTGYIVGLGNSYVTSRSIKQKLVSTSSTEAEILAQTDAVKAAYYVREMLREMSITELQPILLHQDNKSAIYVIKDIGKQRRTRHLIAKLMYVRELVNDRTVEPVYLATKEMTADLLTKALVGALFVQHRSVLMGLLHLRLQTQSGKK